MPESTQSVQFTRREAVLEITLNRPERLNAIDMSVVDGLLAAAEAGASDEVRAVTIRGEGRGFCSGGDVKEFAHLLEEKSEFNRELPDRLHKAVEALHTLPKPVIALVHGPCAGAGTSLALSCDLLIAAEDARFNLAYVGIGLCPDGSSTYFLPRHVGLKRATEIFLTGKTLDAAEMLALGMANRVVPPDQLLATGRGIADMLAQGPTFAYARTKELLRASLTNDLRTQLDLETDKVSACAGTEDFAAGVRAFVAKSAPTFKGS